MAKRGKTNFVKTQDVTEVRIEKWRKYQKFLLIVCEDQNTEPAYFNTFKPFFPEHTLYLDVVGTGRDPLGVVGKAIDSKNNLAGVTKREIDEIWIVFDKDDADQNQTRIDRFEEAFDTAKINEFNVAWSNEVFELWFLLHFIEIDPQIPLSRQEVYKLLKDSINSLTQSEIIKDGHSNPNIIPYLESHGNEENAINRASNLLLHHGIMPPIYANPATKMHLLVTVLRRWIAYYNYKP